MDTNNQGVSQQPEEVQTSPDVAPASETETPQAEVEQTTEARPAEVASDTETSEVDSLPQDQSEQAKAFQKMRQENRELKRQLEDRSKGTQENIFRTLNAPNSDVQKTVQQVINEQKAEEKYPQLKQFNEDGTRNTDFDSEFAEQVQAAYFHEFVQKGDANAVVAASKVAKYYFKAKDTDRVVKEETRKVREQLTAKEQAALAATGRSQPGLGQAQELERLRDRSRRGDTWAIAERLKRAGS